MPKLIDDVAEAIVEEDGIFTWNDLIKSAAMDEPSGRMLNSYRRQAKAAIDVVLDGLVSESIEKEMHGVVLMTYNDGGGYGTIAKNVLRAAAKELKGE